MGVYVKSCSLFGQEIYFIVYAFYSDLYMKLWTTQSKGCVVQHFMCYNLLIHRGKKLSGESDYEINSLG